ncbi:MAG TPA: SDR family NAD(P)-dependent oxidoreductase [Reyranella sp.]|nr:SDR family NAD(P)-dependent oxidoreductase [Reyranella sp.]
MKDIRGKNAFVTGAASGIGLGICRALARAGVNVALADIEQEPLDKAVAEIAATGVMAFGVRLDVSDEAEVKRAAETVGARFGDLHILSNNAGVTFAGSPLLGVPQQQLDWIFGVNVYGTLHCCRAFVPLIQKHGKGGHIVNTASIGGLQVNPLLRNGPYAMTKYAVVAMSETLALDLANEGIGVSVFCPALVATGLYKSAQRRPERFGGAYKPQAGATTAARVMPTNAISGDEAGERVRQAIEDDEFFVFTHPQTRAWIEERHRKLMDGFDRNDRYLAAQEGATQTGRNPA